MSIIDLLTYSRQANRKITTSYINKNMYKFLDAARKSGTFTLQCIFHPLKSSFAQEISTGFNSIEINCICLLAFCCRIRMRNTVWHHLPFRKSNGKLEIFRATSTVCNCEKKRLTKAGFITSIITKDSLWILNDYFVIHGSDCFRMMHLKNILFSDFFSFCFC